jgi:hypothetical protein
VAFTPGGYVAFRPGELLVRSAVADLAAEHLAAWHREAEINREALLEDRWTKFTGVPDPSAALGDLRGIGIFAQPNHVLFAHCCCPPHPSSVVDGGIGATPFLASSLTANPFLASAVLASPFLASPLLSSAGGGGCCCRCGGGGALTASPFLASAGPSPAAAPWFQASGRRRSTARPAPGPEEHDARSGEGVRVAVLDTGLAAVNKPAGLALNNLNGFGDGDEPDEDGDGYLDPVAGHGTFIAGVIEQLAPGCELDVYEVLTTYGDGGEAEIAGVLVKLAAGDELSRPNIVNLSFGSYSPIGMEVLADAIAALREVGVIVVASAGNDASCAPTYPAALPGVVSVGALDKGGRPAAFTNYGPWVRACTIGTDVVSWFFDGFDGAEPPHAKGDDDDFHGWASWSGTSFAAPRVVAALAREISAGADPQGVLAANQPRRPMLGSVVLP